MRVAHVGINATDPADCPGDRGAVLDDDGPTRYRDPGFDFNDSLIEVMKQNGRGTKGHIGFAVNDIDAAEKWFAERGLEVNEESRVLLPDGGTKLVYFKREFAGFAVHLCRE